MHGVINHAPRHIGGGASRSTTTLRGFERDQLCNLYGYGGEPQQPGRCRGEHGGKSVSPARACDRVLSGESAIAQQRLDPRPLAARRDLGPQGTSRLAVRRGIAPRLSEDGAASLDAPSAPQPLLGAGKLDGADPISQLGEQLGRGPSSGGMASGISRASGIGPSERKK